MATVTLTQLYMHLAADPSTYLTHPLHRITELSSSPARIQTFAGGRQRSISGPARPKRFQVSLIRVSSDDLATLNGWRSTLLMLRDVRGRKLWGVFKELDVSDWRGEASHDVDFEFLQTTHSEVV